MGTLLGWLGYQVGQRTDAASSSGSVHAKLGDIKGYMTGTQNTNLNDILAAVNRAPYAAGKTVTLTYGFNYSSSGVVGLTDIMKITGPRVILGGYVEIRTTTDSDINYTFTLDDYTLLNRFNNSYLNSWDPGSWDVSNDTYKNTLAYRNPLNFSAFDDGTGTEYVSPGGSKRWMISFPPLTPISSMLRIAYDSSGNGAPINVGWCIWHTAP